MNLKIMNNDRQSKKSSFNSYALMAIPYATFCPASAPDRRTIGGDAVASLRLHVLPSQYTQAFETEGTSDWPPTAQTFVLDSAATFEFRFCPVNGSGRVTRFIDVEGAIIAEAEVLRMLKGHSRVKRLYFVAQPTWACDTSGAVLNETALLFLELEPAGVDESSPFSQRLRGVIGDNPLLLITWSGRGRLPVIRVGQTDYLPVLADAKMADVRFPKQIGTIPMPESRERDVRLARLEDVITFIKRKAGS